MLLHEYVFINGKSDPLWHNSGVTQWNTHKDTNCELQSGKFKIYNMIKQSDRNEILNELRHVHWGLIYFHTVSESNESIRLVLTFDHFKVNNTSYILALHAFSL